MRAFIFIFVWVQVGIFSVNKSLADWPQFRGPVGNGHIGKLNHPVKWSMNQNLAWSQPIPGGGWSSPIIAGSDRYSH